MTESISFEEQIKQLEELVKTLETGDINLDDALSQYEQGVKMIRQCQQLLKDAEQKITMLGQIEDTPDA